MKIRGKCVGCRKQKWFIYKRKLRIPHINVVTTSVGDLCMKCFINLRKVK